MIDEQQLAALGARRISTDTDPDDLVLPEVSGRRLGWIANWLSQPPFIFREWGLSRFVDGGLRVLFRGPSGTGKTMAAVALAKSAGLDLYRVDVSAITSKYIADTERNIRQAFAGASDAGVVLLFDEADVLFDKRSEVRDAHNHNANIDATDLLRRIEPFAGLAIFATNRPSDIEADTLSRIDVLIDFPMPDEAAREAIWRKLIAAVKLPRAGELDVRPLANQYELSGAEILRCVRVASLLAATDDRSLDMELLTAAAKERVAMRERRSH